MKTGLRFIAGIAAISFSVLALAQPAKYPVKPIRMVVGYAAGGGSDIMGRLIAQQMAEGLGQQVIVENRPGAAQNVAAEFVARCLCKGCADRKSTRLNSSHVKRSRMPSSA